MNSGSDHSPSVAEGLKALSTRLNSIISARLTDVLRGLPWTTILTELDRAKGHAPKIYAAEDLQPQLKMLTERLGGLGHPFDDHQRTVSILGGELRIARNRWAHQDEFSALDAYRVHDFAARLLEHLGDSDGAEDAAARRDALLPAMMREAGIDALSAPAQSQSMISASATLEEIDDDSASEVDVVLPDESVLERETTELTPSIGRARLMFDPWSPVVVGDVGVLDDLPKKAAKEVVRAVASEIIDREGPIHVDRLAPLVGLAFGVQRLHAARAQKIIRQVKSAGFLIDGQRFVWPQDVDPNDWQEFRPNSSDVQRPFLHISPVEIANAARQIRNQAPSDELDQAQLETKILSTFGRRRRTAQFLNHIRKSLALHGPSAHTD